MHVAINKAINKYFGINLMSTPLFPFERHEGICRRGSTALPFLPSALDEAEASSLASDTSRFAPAESTQLPIE
jgi:hypothetical protein